MDPSVCSKTSQTSPSLYAAWSSELWGLQATLILIRAVRFPGAKNTLCPMTSRRTEL